MGGVGIVGSVLERREFGVRTQRGYFLIVNRASEKNLFKPDFQSGVRGYR